MATNMVPAISSAALPTTPAEEWADGMNEFIGTHVTRTPVGTPGPAVPGAFESTPVSAPVDVGHATAIPYTSDPSIPQARPWYNPPPHWSRTRVPSSRWRRKSRLQRRGWCRPRCRAQSGVNASTTQQGVRPTPNPDLLPSHPAAGPQPHIHAYPTHTHDIASASSESGLVSPPPSTNTSTFPPFVGDLALPTTSRSTHRQVHAGGSAALNSSQLADVVPSGDFDRSSHHVAASTQHGGNAHGGSGMVPTGDPASTEYNTSTPDTADGDGDASGTGGEDGDGNLKADGAWGEKNEGRKGKLLQTLKAPFGSRPGR
ncbi:hypothetical protein B0H16DRAFT_1562594 [Mycena metata]|uniref:Uncharacterized protein n=1 Tax=Mycena metata TaxID=1033252 RepID=A0AAD7N1X8_9AGAR|nr:hypothetical protein B0H16DRAFT_1562594 [Mycena metata]